MRGAALVLAAGRSRRMGQPKAALALGSRTFLGTILGRLPPDLWVGVVVPEPVQVLVRLPQTGPDERNRVIEKLIQSEPVGAGTREEPLYIVNPHPEKGQLASLQQGLLAGAAKFAFTLVALVDLPAVSATTYERLVSAAEAGGGDLWVPRYDGRRGHPVVFGQACYEDLMRAPLEEGSRWAVARHRSRRIEVEVDDPEIHRDVDTPADYRRLLEEMPGEDAGS